MKRKRWEVTVTIDMPDNWDGHKNPIEFDWNSMINCDNEEDTWDKEMEGEDPPRLTVVSVGASYVKEPDKGGEA